MREAGSLRIFVWHLQKAAPKIHIVHEKDESDAPSELRIHSRIRYRAVPLGHELAPFLEALSWIFNGQALPSLPFSSLLERLTLPADLKLYIAEQCPFCPVVVESLLPLAISSDWIQVTVIDAGLYMEEARATGFSQFPHWFWMSNFAGPVPSKFRKSWRPSSIGTLPDSKPIP